MPSARLHLLEIPYWRGVKDLRPERVYTVKRRSGAKNGGRFRQGGVGKRRKQRGLGYKAKVALETMRKRQAVSRRLDSDVPTEVEDRLQIRLQRRRRMPGGKQVANPPPDGACDLYGLA